MPECKSIHKIIYANQPSTVRAPWNQFVSAIKAPGQEKIILNIDNCVSNGL